MNLPKLFFYHYIHFRKWDARTPDVLGIGMSECQNIQIAERLAKRGFDVTSYAPLPDDIPEEVYKGVTWKRIEMGEDGKPTNVDWTQKGVWFLYRDPTLFDHFPEEHPGQTLISVSQDEYYHFNEQQTKTMDMLFCFTEDHGKNYIYHNEKLKDKIRLTHNGIRMDLIRELEKGEIPERNPYRITYASSPDRGLLALIDIYKRAKEFVPELELHLGYSFYNIDRLIEKGPKFAHFQKQKDEILEALKGVRNVYWMSGDSSMPITQPQLYKEWMKTGFFVYCTNFRETSCAALAEAQALGAVPLVSPVWALRTNTLSGLAIDGDANDPMTKCTFTAELVKLCRNAEFREQLRSDAKIMARIMFNWERIVDGWEALILGWAQEGRQLIGAQYNFQTRNLEGKTLNLCSHIDASGLKKYHGAVNFDIQPLENVDIVGDARNVPEDLYGQFDTVIVGDCLEHFQEADAVSVLQNAKKCLRDSGKIVVTVPDDQRTPEEQSAHLESQEHETYPDGATHYHTPHPKELIESWIEKAGLSVEQHETIDYDWAVGNGWVCKIKEAING
jgi:predicted SAM-dependent methyltransferase/glycosyltransferase involved in cell wall biosynthesis